VSGARLTSGSIPTQRQFANPKRFVISSWFAAVAKSAESTTTVFVALVGLSNVSLSFTFDPEFPISTSIFAQEHMPAALSCQAQIARVGCGCGMAIFWAGSPAGLA
jgi:hypothetical protein